MSVTLYLTNKKIFESRNNQTVDWKIEIWSHIDLLYPPIKLRTKETFFWLLGMYKYGAKYSRKIDVKSEAPCSMTSSAQLLLLANITLPASGQNVFSYPSCPLFRIAVKVSIFHSSRINKQNLSMLISLWIYMKYLQLDVMQATINQKCQKHIFRCSQKRFQTMNWIVGSVNIRTFFWNSDVSLV